MQLGAIVGRFQVPELTDGHKKLIDLVKSRHGQVLIAVGCITAKERTKRDPLDYAVREAMIKAEFPDAIVIPVTDCPGNNELWSQNLDSVMRTICPMGEITLYGGRDSFIPFYTGRFPTYKIELEFSPSGTDLREYTSNRIRISGDFRAGMIYSMVNMYQRVYPTVDIAIISDGHVLMGRKPNETLWRFPGGFADVRDKSFEESAIREAKEETGITAKTLDYLGSFRTSDTRYNPEKDDAAITTTLFGCQHWEGKPEAGDDLKELHWFRVSVGGVGWRDKDVIPDSHVNPVHLPLFRRVCAQYRNLAVKGENSV